MCRYVLRDCATCGPSHIPTRIETALLARPDRPGKRCFTRSSSRWSRDKELALQGEQGARAPARALGLTPSSFFFGSQC